jgi:hypothetical protein
MFTSSSKSITDSGFVSIRAASSIFNLHFFNASFITSSEALKPSKNIFRVYNPSFSYSSLKA